MHTTPVCLSVVSPVQLYWHVALLLATKTATATLLRVEISKLQMGRKWKE